MCVCDHGRVCLCACMRTPFVVVSLLSLFTFLVRGDKNIVVALSQFVATYNLLYFFLFALPNSHQI